MSKCYKMDNTGIFEEYGDRFYLENNNKIILISTNINSLCIEGQKVKNEQARYFVLSTQADIIVF